jgi:hypothetical protein
MSRLSCPFSFRIQWLASLQNDHDRVGTSAFRASVLPARARYRLGTVPMTSLKAL